MRPSKTKPYRQVELRREVTKGWGGMSGRCEVMLMLPDEDVQGLGTDFYATALSAPNTPWTVAWRSVYAELR